MNNRLEKIEDQLDNIQIILDRLDTNIIQLNDKLNIKREQDDKVLEECNRMGTHIDFIENVYDTVKHPLGYICNKIKYMTGYSHTYQLVDISNNSGYRIVSL